MPLTLSPKSDGTLTLTPLTVGSLAGAYYGVGVYGVATYGSAGLVAASTNVLTLTPKAVG